MPAYFYPPAYWNQLTASAGTVSITAVLNPNNGPGAAQDSNYVAAVNALRAAGGKVIGYVPTTYGARSLTDVQNDINTYLAWYSLDGIFVDEMTNNNSPANLTYYNQIYTYIKGLNPAFTVVGNPGAPTLAQYLTQPCADILITYEDSGSNYAAHVPDAWNTGYPSSHFANLIHGVSSQTTMESFVQLAATRNVGHIFITNDTLSNPWDTLPPYWDALVQAVSLIPEPGAGWVWLGLMVAAAAGLKRGRVMCLAARSAPKRID